MVCNAVQCSKNVPTFRKDVIDNKVRELDIRGIVHYEFVPTGQSTKFTIWKY